MIREAESDPSREELIALIGALRAENASLKARIAELERRLCQRRSEIASVGRSKIASSRVWRIVDWDSRHGWPVCSVARAVKPRSRGAARPWARGFTAIARTELSFESREARCRLRSRARARQFSVGSSDDGSGRERFERRLL